MLRVKGQDGFLPLGPESCPRRSSTHRIHAAHVPQRRGRPGGARPSDLICGVAYQLADLSPADHARARATSSSPARRPTRGRWSRATSSRSRSTASAGSRTPSSSGTSTCRGRASSPRSPRNTLHVALAIPEDEAERMVEGSTAMKSPRRHEPVPEPRRVRLRRARHLRARRGRRPALARGDSPEDASRSRRPSTPAR